MIRTLIVIIMDIIMTASAVTTTAQIITATGAE